MASYLRINSSQWRISFSLWPHFLQSLPCPFCSCHTDLLPNSSLNNDAPSLDSVHLLGLLLPVLLLHMTEWLTPAPHSGLCSNVPHWERTALKNTTPSSNHHSMSLPWLSFLLALSPDAPLHVYLSLVRHISSSNISSHIGKDFVMFTPGTVWHKADT